jgi:internalin A
LGFGIFWNLGFGAWNFPWKGLEGTMTSDLELIKQLEKEIGIKLEERKLEEIDEYNKHGYASGENGEVVGLNLDEIELKPVPVSVSKLRHLKKLSLYDTKLTDISFLQGLSNLTHLNLIDNQITDISFLQGLSKLTELSLSSNKITDYSFLQGLSKLTLLDLSSNQITDISFLQGLSKLTQLNLSYNQITDISFLQGLSNLTELDLRSNQITDISFLQGLSNLTLLDLSSNKITDISFLQGLSNLTRLDLINNQIKELPEALVELGLEIDVDELFTWGQKIYLYKNPLEKPPLEIIRNGIPAIKAYFQSLKKETNLPLNEVKVLLVGDGAAGKTSLVKQMRGQDFNKNESQTHGINIDSWEVNQDETKIKVRLWDFGGQEIMHATHQFFLSKRSLYILVLDGRKDEKTEYWLNHVNSFGGGSPVMVVLNKIDQHPGFEVNRRFLQDKYPNIKGFYRVSCATGEGITDFKNALARELAVVELMRTTWAQNWFKVKSRLEQMTENFISYQQYREICTAENIHDESAQETLADFLNDLGVILRFKDFQLEDTHVLEPRWITNAVYKIINSHILSASHGVLEIRCLKETLKPTPGEDKGFHYPADKYPYILQLMKKFELCYAIDENRMLVPDLLSAEEPALAFEKTNALAFRFHYNFLPRSIMPRFIVKRHQDIKNELRWRTGVVLEEKRLDAAALVKVDEREKKIFIYVTGSPPRDYFAVLRKTFYDIHDSFEKLEVEEWISLPDHDKIAVEYQELLGFELAGREEIFIGKLGKAYRVQQLLSGIEKPGDRQPLRMHGEITGKYLFNRESEESFQRYPPPRTISDIPPVKEIYISYAWGGESEEIANRLDEAFKEKGITIIRDKRDLGFKGRIKEFMEQIGRGKCVVLVISNKYLESRNCMFELMQIAKSGDFYGRIFPVVLDDVKIYDPEERIEYVKYWEKKKKALDDKMKSVSSEYLDGFREDIDLYADIRQYLPRLTDILRDMNTLTVEIHSQTGFEELVRAAAAKIEE